MKARQRRRQPTRTTWRSVWDSDLKEQTPARGKRKTGQGHEEREEGTFQKKLQHLSQEEEKREIWNKVGGRATIELTEQKEAKGPWQYGPHNRAGLNQLRCIRRSQAKRRAASAGMKRLDTDSTSNGDRKRYRAQANWRHGGGTGDSMSLKSGGGGGKKETRKNERRGGRKKCPVFTVK